jgi:hypothetical protein
MSWTRQHMRERYVPACAPALRRAPYDMAYVVNGLCLSWEAFQGEPLIQNGRCWVESGQQVQVSLEQPCRAPSCRVLAVTLILVLAACVQNQIPPNPQPPLLSMSQNLPKKGLDQDVSGTQAVLIQSYAKHRSRHSQNWIITWLHTLHAWKVMLCWLADAQPCYLTRNISYRLPIDSIKVGI